MASRLILNASSNALPTVVKTCIAFFMSPIILHALGNYDYGIWEIVFSVLGYMGVLDVGLQPAVVRYVARYTALQQREDLQRVLSTTFFFLGVVGTTLCLVMWVAAVLAPHFLSPPTGGTTRYTFFLIIIGIQLLVIFPGSVFDCFLQGLQRYSIRTTANVVSLVLGAAVIAPLLTHGFGLVALAIADVAGRFSKFVFFAWWLSRPANGGYFFRRCDVRLSTLREMLAFGVKNLVYAISVRLATVTDPLLIGAFLGAAVVPFYVIPANLLGYGKSLVWQATDVLMPYFSQIDAHGDRDAVRHAYLESARYSFGAVVPVMVGIAMLGPAFISKWMGAEYARRGTGVLYLMVAACAMTFLNSNCSRYLIGSNRHDILAKVGLASAIVNVIISAALVPALGIEGVAAGTFISYTFAEPYLLWVVCQKLEMSLWKYLQSTVLPVLPAALSQLLFLYVWKSQWQLDSYIGIFSAALCSLVLYTPLFFLSGVDRSQRQRFLRLIGCAAAGVGETP